MEGGEQDLMTLVPRGKEPFPRHTLMAWIPPPRGGASREPATHATLQMLPPQLQFSPSPDSPTPRVVSSLATSPGSPAIPAVRLGWSRRGRDRWTYGWSHRGDPSWHAGTQGPAMPRRSVWRWAPAQRWRL